MVARTKKLFIGAIVLFVACCAFIVFLVGCCNEAVLSTRTPQFLRLLVMFFNPPQDLYRDIAVSDLKDGTCELRFAVKYSGTYTIDYEPKRSDGLDAHLNRDVIKVVGDIKVRFSDGENTLIEKAVNLNKSTAYSRNGGSGYSIVSFDVPSPIPTNRNILCTVQLFSENNTMNSSGRIYIRKMSEE